MYLVGLLPHHKVWMVLNYILGHQPIRLDTSHKQPVQDSWIQPSCTVSRIDLPTSSLDSKVPQARDHHLSIPVPQRTV